MNKLMKQFIIRSIILSIAYLIVGGILYFQFIPQYYQNILPFILAFFFLTTNLIHAYSLRIAKKRIAKFSSQFIALSSLKMLFYLIVAVIFIVVNKEQAKLFLINYLATYVGFTILEIAEISRIVKLKD